MIDALPLLLSDEGYQISRSVRLRSSASAYFSRTPASAGNRRTWTWSGWVKRGTVSPRVALFGFGTSSAGGSASGACYFDSNTIYVVSGGGTSTFVSTTPVYRDPSAWYHVVIAFDSTQATASNRVKIYINGSQVTALANTTYPSQNYDSDYNNTTPQYLGARGEGGLDSYFDGCITEINSIDGQALTPASFGETNAVTGVWQPKKYTGTYGTNGFYLPFLQNTTATYGATFNGSSQYLTVPASSLFAPGTGDFTLEAWVNTASATDGQYVWSQTVSGTNYFVFSVDAAAKRASFVATTSGGGTPITSTANLVVGGWNHIAVVRQSGTVTVYCNGVGGTATSNTMDINNTTYVPTIGRYTHTASQWFNGVISNLRYVKGTAVYTSNFTPASAPLTAISGTSFLSLQSSTLVDNSVNALTITNNGSVATSIQYPFNTGTSIGNDQSGQGNNWTPNNISLANNSTYDSMLDVPTQWADGGNGRGNYATLNPVAATGGVTLTNGNLRASVAQKAAPRYISVSTIAFTGIVYAEVTITPGGGPNPSPSIGIKDSNYKSFEGSATTAGQFAYGFRDSSTPNILKDENGVSSTLVAGGSMSSGDVMMLAVDVAAGKMWLGKNGSWLASGNPATGANPAISGFSTTVPYWFFCATDQGTTTDNVFEWNFGQRPFAYTAPSGFKALNTLNLPTPTILKGNQYFDATTWTGNGSTQTITNSGAMQPDFVWVKQRSSTAWHSLVDSVRGVTKYLYSNSTDAEGTQTTLLTSFNSNGFSLGSDSNVNANAATYVGWQWKEGATQGFDIVTYTGTGATLNVSHNLGVAPKMIITKSRSAVGGWPVYHASIGATGAVQLESTGATNTTSAYWNNTAPTSTQFTLASGLSVNGTTYVAYLFSEVAGFSKFGSYTGNGSADGPFVFCGFRPRWVMIKRTDAVSNWWIENTANIGYNTTASLLSPNTSDAEYGSASYFDLLSNGFKLRQDNTTGYANASGGTYIFAAFAENPFKNSLAR